MPGADYDDAIARSGLPQAAALRALLRPGLAFKTEEAAAHAVGRSRLGGRPDLPPGFAWPEWKGKPQAFLAQIDLAGLPSIPDRDLLPAAGRLYFFYDAEQECWGYDPEHRGSFAVVHDDTPADRLRPGPPSRGRGRKKPGPALAVTGFEAIQTAPDFTALAVKRLGLADGEVDRYIETIEAAEVAGGVIHKEQIFEVVAVTTSDPDEEGDPGETSLTDAERAWLDGDDGDDPGEASPLSEDGDTVEDGPFHQMLGHPRAVQNAMEWECALVDAGLYCGDSTGYRGPRAEALKAEADDWLLLLQLDSDDRLGWQWGDVGRIYYWMRRDDLTARRFDRAWLVLQCG